MCSLLVQASVASYQFQVLSVVPRSVIPPASAPASVGLATLPSSMFLSSTVTVVLLTVVVVPLTVRLPPTVTLPVVESVSTVAPLKFRLPVKVLAPLMVCVPVSETYAPAPAIAGIVVASPLMSAPLP